MTMNRERYFMWKRPVEEDGKTIYLTPHDDPIA